MILQDAETILDNLRSGDEEERRRALFEAELIHFSEDQVVELLPLLWDYIKETYNGDTEFTPVGSAIRKYGALMPLKDIGQLSILLEEDVNPDVKIEAAKTIYHNFKVFPPSECSPEPELETLLFSIAKSFSNVVNENKLAAAALCATRALIAMRSSYAQEAWVLANQRPWFGELVEDEVQRLRNSWKNLEDTVAVEWLDEITPI